METKFDGGYDSDGGVPPGITNEDFDEGAIRERLVDGQVTRAEGDETAAEEEVEGDIANEEPRHIPIDEASLKKLNVAAIKHELRIREVQFTATLKTTDLLQRLQLALEREVKVSIFGTSLTDKVAKTKASTVNDMAGFAPGAYWEQLKAQNEESVDEPHWYRRCWSEVASHSQT
jgi:hypothetical protein